MDENRDKHLTKFGFNENRGGVHIARTMMLDELSTLLDFVADEIIRSLGGSIGLITVIPITAFLASFLYQSKK